MRVIRLVAFAVLFIVTGWMMGRAQTTQPEFEIQVTAPGGRTTIECLRGCALAWVERGVNPTATPIRTFTFSCSAATCSSAKVGGWLR